MMSSSMRILLRPQYINSMDLQSFSLVLMGIITMIILYATLGNYLQHKKIHVIHETGIGILIGMLFGTGLYLFGEGDQIKFSQKIFFYGLLPPMIFAGGYNLKKKDFGKNFFYILLFGLLGTIVSFGVIFGLTFAINELHWIVPLRSQNHIQNLQTGLMIKYSATISATDSVAALTLIKASEFPKMFSIIFGEGMVNDAVAIILFKVVGGIFDDIKEHGMELGAWELTVKILGSFLITVVCSVAIGMASALICSYLFKKGRFLVESEVIQLAITYMFGILSYVVAQLFDMSGVITVLISGVGLAHYNFYNLTVGGMHATAVSFQAISFVAEAIVFIYLGISTIFYLTTEVISFSFLGLELLICVISRVTAIFGLSLLFRLIKKDKWKVSNKQLSIVTLAGTIRGSVAFALILTIEQDHQNADQVSVIKSTTLIMVCLTTIVMGALMPKFIHFFLGDADSKQTKKQDKYLSIKEQLLEEEEFKQKKDKKKGFFSNADQNYWRPFFIYDYVIRKPMFKTYKNLLKFNSRGEYEGGNFNLLVMQESRQSTLIRFEQEVNRKDSKRSIVPENLSQVTNPSQITNI